MGETLKQGPLKKEELLKQSVNVIKSYLAQLKNSL